MDKVSISIFFLADNYIKKYKKINFCLEAIDREHKKQNVNYALFKNFFINFKSDVTFDHCFDFYRVDINEL